MGFWLDFMRLFIFDRLDGRYRRYDHLITAPVFCLVTRLVGTVVQFIERFATNFLCHTKRPCHCQYFSAGFNFCALERGTQALRYAMRLLQVICPQENAKLFPAKPANEIGLTLSHNPNGSLQQSTHQFQHLIADSMPIGIIDILKMI
jgi:hypothetical protein